jgi:hypothetical protein
MKNRSTKFSSNTENTWSLPPKPPVFNKLLISFVLFQVVTTVKLSMFVLGAVTPWDLLVHTNVSGGNAASIFRAHRRMSRKGNQLQGHGLSENYNSLADKNWFIVGYQLGNGGRGVGGGAEEKAQSLKAKRLVYQLYHPTNT